MFYFYTFKQDWLEGRDGEFILECATTFPIMTAFEFFAKSNADYGSVVIQRGGMDDVGDCKVVKCEASNGPGEWVKFWLIFSHKSISKGEVVALLDL